MDVAEPGIRVAAVQPPVGRLRLEAGVERRDRPGRRIREAHRFRTRPAGAQPHLGGASPARRAFVEVEPGVSGTLATVVAVRDQHDDVLLARAEVGERVRRDARRELVERDPVGSAFGVHPPGKAPQQTPARLLGVASGGIGEHGEAAAAEHPAHRRARRRSGRQARAHGRIGTGAGGRPLVRRRAERQETGQPPVDEGFAVVRFEPARDRADHLPRRLETGLVAQGVVHGGRGVQQDPDPRPGGGADEAEGVPAALRRRRGVGRGPAPGAGDDPGARVGSGAGTGWRRREPETQETDAGRENGTPAPAQGCGFHGFLLPERGGGLIGNPDRRRRSCAGPSCAGRRRSRHRPGRPGARDAGPAGASSPAGSPRAGLPGGRAADGALRR